MVNGAGRRIAPATPAANSTARSDPGGRSAGSPLRFLGLVRHPGVFVGLLVVAGVAAVIVGTVLTEAPPIPGITAGALVRYGIPVVRLLLDLSITAAVGLGIAPKLLGFDRPEAVEPVVAPSRRAGMWASAVWTVTALLAIVLLAAELQPGQQIAPADIADYIGAIAAGKGLVVTAVCGLVSWWLWWLSTRYGEKVPTELRAGIALFGLLPLPLTGHASNWYYHDLSMISMELHVAGSAAWAGGLVVLVVLLARHRDLLGTALPKFSKLATWCVFVVGLTGVANGLLELALSPITELPGSLWQTRYGALILAKGACLAVVAAVAIRVRRRILPAVAGGRRSAFAAWCGWEVAVLTVAFGIAVVLTRASVTGW